MKIEFEGRALEINPQEVSSRILQAGGTLTSDRLLQRRFVYDAIPVSRTRWVRLRTDGRTTTLTLKVIHHAAIDGTEETEIVVDSFDATHALLTGIGLSARSYQENYRTAFELAGAQVTIDEWPLVPPWVEVEGDSKEQVERVFSLLGISPAAIVTDDVSSIFEKRYGIKVDEMPRLTFKQ